MKSPKRTGWVHNQTGDTCPRCKAKLEVLVTPQDEIIAERCSDPMARGCGWEVRFA